MQLGQQLRDKRKALGWTQGVAAQKIGIQQSYLSKLENNQFIPSQDVLEQLKQVYELDLSPASPRHLKSTLSNRNWVIAVALLCVAIAAIFIAQSGVVYSQTYYTYEAKPIGELKQQALLSYELTDEYRGEVYQAKFAGQVYRYQLLGERKIARKENTWLMLFGAILAFSCGCYVVYLWFVNRASA